MTLAESVLAGNRLALSQLLTHVENNTPEGREAINRLFPETGQAHLIGITGAPGVGKSALVNQLALYYRHPLEGQAARRVAIVAIDPSSPFTGGAILGDRIRMKDLAGDPGIFIRSMASRGSLGGLASTTAEVVQVFDAAGYETILIETVGAGQGEVDIARLAHTTLVVEAPGMGDEIQAIKAGILEIADVLVVNKADRPGVENTERALKNMLELSHPVSHLLWHHDKSQPSPPSSREVQAPIWVPPIQRTVATEGVGVADLGEMIAQHRQYLQQSGNWQHRDRARLQSELEALLRETLVSRWRRTVSEPQYQAVLDLLFKRQISPFQAVERLVDIR